MSEFVMPQPEIGDIVLFTPHQGGEWTPAIVVKTGSRALVLHSLLGGIKNSVHHVDDQGINEFPDWAAYGQWKEKPRDPAIAILREKVALLEAKLKERGEKTQK